MSAKRLSIALLASCLLAACQVISPVTQEPSNMISHDGVDIQYEVHGKGSTALVFVHGWSCDRSYWADQIDAFSEQFTVVTVDLAGHGESGHTRSDWSIPAFGGDVAAVVGQLPHERVILVGHSMGGQVVVAAARQLGDRVVKVVGIDTLQQVTAGRSLEASQARWAAFDDDFPVKVNGFVRSQFFLKSSDPALIEKVANDMSAAPKAVAIAAGVGLSVYDTLDGLTAISATPLTLINAVIVPTDEDAHRAIRESFTLRLMPTSGHFPMLEQPDEFNAVLLDVVQPYR